MVSFLGLKGIEPSTPRFGSARSNPLSYKPRAQIKIKVQIPGLYNITNAVVSYDLLYRMDRCTQSEALRILQYVGDHRHTE